MIRSIIPTGSQQRDTRVDWSETRIVDPDDHEVGPDVVGEIVTRGPAVMTEYWANPEATRRGAPQRLDAHRRCRVPRDDGYIYVTDRIKDMIISGGENVYPREVEDVLYRPRRRARSGRDRRARRTLGRAGARDRRASARTRAPKQSALEHCRAQLAGYKTPRSVEFADALPKNATGKILKTELRARFSR